MQAEDEIIILPAPRCRVNEAKWKLVSFQQPKTRSNL
jgi:hypothetical protein